MTYSRFLASQDAGSRMLTAEIDRATGTTWQERRAAIDAAIDARLRDAGRAALQPDLPTCTAPEASVPAASAESSQQLAEPAAAT